MKKLLFGLVFTISSQAFASEVCFEVYDTKSLGFPGKYLSVKTVEKNQPGVLLPGDINSASILKPALEGDLFCTDTVFVNPWAKTFTVFNLEKK